MCISVYRYVLIYNIIYLYILYKELKKEETS